MDVYSEKKFIFKIIPCPLCGQDKFRVLGEKEGGFFSRSDSTAVPARIVSCLSCSLIYVNPMPFPGRLDSSDIYNEEYTEMLSKSIPFDQLSERDIDVFEGRLRLERMESIIGHRGRLLDIGCGPGNLLVQSIRSGWDATGLEVNRESAHFAREVNKVPVVTGMLEDFEHSWKESFDAVYFNQVLEHTQEPLKFLKTVRRILKPRGVVFCGVPNESCFMNHVGHYYFKFRLSPFTPFLSPTFSPYHMIGFSTKSIRQAFEMTGFEVIEIRNINYTSIGEVFGGKKEFLKRIRIFLGLLARMAGHGYGLDVYGVPK